MALPGSVYIYQGEELGLWEVEDIPDELRQDPIWHRTNGAEPGRDGCRVPLPWSGNEPPFGFSPAGAAASPGCRSRRSGATSPWRTSRRSQDSVLCLYTEALRLRRTLRGVPDGRFSWREAPDGALSFARVPAVEGTGVRCIANLSPVPVDLPPGAHGPARQRPARRRPAAPRHHCLAKRPRLTGPSWRVARVGGSVRNL